MRKGLIVVFMGFVCILFFDAIEGGGTTTPGFAEGYRVQQLIDAARQSHQQGAWIDIVSEATNEEMRA